MGPRISSIPAHLLSSGSAQRAFTPPVMPPVTGRSHTWHSESEPRRLPARLLFIMAAEIKFAHYFHAENLRCSTACNCNVCRVGRGEGAYGQAENPAVLPERAADKRDLRLRSGKNGVPEGNVVPRLREHLQAINQYNQHTGASGLLSLRPLRPTSPPADEFRKW